MGTESSEPRTATATTVAPEHDDWWKDAVVYQIYPKSFNDSDGDGIGDIRGIIEKLDYIKALGPDVVWLNPVYASPEHDNGYDISDYRRINPQYGTMQDWENLRDGLHDHSIKLIMDLVVNHTSDQHEWFQQSRREEDPFTDYYIWRDGNPDTPPNNWESIFGGPAWSYDDEREEWYLHLFDESQPDLNWDNPRVREELYDMMHWWLENGIDGFRMDVINFISKAPGLPDGDPDADGAIGSEHFIDGPNVHTYLQEMHREVLQHYDEIVTIGEMPGVTVDEARRYTGTDGDGLDMVFHFDHVGIDHGEHGWWDVYDWDLEELRDCISTWQTGLQEDGWEGVYLNNHDQPRMVSRFGDENHHYASATMLATLIHTLRGTPFVYQGEEIGMTNFPFDREDQFRDVATLNRLHEKKEVGRTFAELKDVLQYRSRDNARTPMQWDDSTHAGFTDGEPWIPVNPNHTDINTDAALTDSDSIFHYYTDLFQIRKQHDALVNGRYEVLMEDDPTIYAYLREAPEESALVILNVSPDPSLFQLPEHVDAEQGELLLSNYDVTSAGIDGFELQPFEARVYRLQ